MKRTFSTFLILLLFHNISDAQTFKLTDTIFYPGLKLVRGILYNPGCQIEINSLPFVDSLAKFLIANENIVIEISFHSEIRGAEKMNQMRTEGCGKSRLESMFTYNYPSINKERIKYVCYGESKPIYTLNEMEKITDKNKRNIAHMANARTVIEIIQVDFK